MDRNTYLRIVAHIERMLIEEYPAGGSQSEKWDFFSRLDESYRQPWIVDGILEWLLFYPNLVLTGGFGQYVVERLQVREDLAPHFNYILLNGRLRSGEAPMILDIKQDNWCEPKLEPWVLFDDSHYSGRTRFIISSFLREKMYIDLRSSVVIYDGCSSWNPHVAALYRWYAVHGLDEFPVEKSK